MRRFVIVLICLILTNGSASGAKLTNELYVGIADSKIVSGERIGGQFGAAMTTGDFNSDGYEDIAVGAPFSSIGPNKWAGSVSIIFGGEEGQAWTIFGENDGDQLGSTLESGDYNDDGIDDLAIGSYNGRFEEGRPGRVDIFYGELTLGRQASEFVNFKPDLTLSGESTDDAFGMSLSTLDINNDDIDDLLVGAPFAGNSGKAYGYFGNKNGIENKDFLTLEGQKEGEKFGSAVSGGNIMGGSGDEIVIGAYYSGTEVFDQVGSVYIYKEIRATSGTVRTPTYVLSGDLKKEWFGFDLDVGDIDGDGIEDIAVTSFPYAGDRSKGKVSVFLGAKQFDPGKVFEINDPVGELSLGTRVLISDLNADKKAEIIIGAPGVGDPVSINQGDVYILNGRDLFESEYSVKNGDLTSMIHGENPDDWFGYSLESLDHNNDGLKDLVVGSRYSDTEDAVNNGKVFILFGDGKEYGTKKVIAENDSPFFSRAEFISEVVEKFDLKAKKSNVINQCYEYREFCLFNFTTVSSYERIQLEPLLVLYPDVLPGSKYYDDITVGTVLGLINGYVNEKDSPFRPESPVSRIQALKVVLGAADLVPPKYKFELVDVLGSLNDLQNQASYFGDVNPQISHMWWYPRYTNFAVENNIIKKGDLFRPDDNITMEEFDSIVSRTQEYLRSQNEEIKP